MERAGGASGGDLPTFDADLDAAVVAPAGTGLPRRRAGGGRSAGIAVAAVALLTAGIAIGGVLNEPPPSVSPAPTETSPPAAAFACVPVAYGSLPSFSLGVAGLERTYSGRRGRTDRPGDEITPSWEISDEWRPSTLASGSALELRTRGDACISHVSVEYAEAGLGHPPRWYDLNVLIDAAVQPASPSPPIGTMPDGDWLIRAVAHVESGDVVLAEFYFRVQVGPGPFASPTPVPTPTPEPTPAVTPAVACGPAPAAAEGIQVTVGAPGQAAVAGGADEADPPIANVGVGDLLDVAVVGDACATSWDIRLVPDESGREATDTQDNPSNDPAFAAQNRWQLRVDVAYSRLVAALRFGDLQVVRYWRVVGQPYLAPGAIIVAADGRQVAVLPGCGTVVRLANGYQASDSCASIGFPTGLETLRVPAWSVVTIEVPGWTISSWSGSCGQVTSDGAGLDYFNQVDGCYLGNYVVTGGATPPAPARFLARPGEQVVQLGLTVTRDGDTVEVQLYGLVTGE